MLINGSHYLLGVALRRYQDVNLLFVFMNYDVLQIIAERFSNYIAFILSIILCNMCPFFACSLIDTWVRIEMLDIGIFVDCNIQRIKILYYGLFSSFASSSR